MGITPEKANPFRFGAPVEGDFYFERLALRDSCDALLKNGMALMLVGPRRFGKTSFARNFCNFWEKQQYGGALLVDVYNVASHQDFLLQLLYALRNKQSLWEKICEFTKNIPDRIWPDRLNLENEAFGKLTLEWLAENSAEQKKLYIKKTLDSLSNLNGHLCLVLDECQQLSEEVLGDGGWLEATLREQIQRQTGEVAYMMTGSRRDLVHAMVNDSHRPLYRAFNVMDFPALGDDFNLWIIERLTGRGVHVTVEAVEYLRREVNHSPNYVQMVCFHLVAHGYGQVDQETIDQVLATIAAQNAYSYEIHMQNLSPVQKRVLRMVALEDEGYFSEQMLKRYEISTAAHVTGAINALKKKNILDPESSSRGGVMFDDPLFRLWIRHKFGGVSYGDDPQLRFF